MQLFSAAGVVPSDHQVMTHREDYRPACLVIKHSYNNRCATDTQDRHFPFDNSGDNRYNHLKL